MPGVVVAVVVGTAFATVDFACSEDALKSISDYQCEDLVPKVIDISEENKHPIRPSILKIYEVKEVSRRSRRPACSGDTRTSRGGNQPLTFYVKEDKDGVLFVGYKGH